MAAFGSTVHSSEACEVALKHYLKKYFAREKESEHRQKVAIEIALILKEEFLIMGCIWRDGNTISVSPRDTRGFEAITDVVKEVI